MKTMTAPAESNKVGERDSVVSGDAVAINAWIDCAFQEVSFRDLFYLSSSLPSPAALLLLIHLLALQQAVLAIYSSSIK
jgi:hypothetical protein